MSTKNESDDSYKRKVGHNARNHLYTSWMGSLRAIGMDHGMTVNEVRTKFHLNTIGTLFIDKVIPIDAFKILNK